MTFAPAARAQRRTRRMRRHLPGKGRRLPAAVAQYFSVGVMTPEEVAEFQQEWDAALADTWHRHVIRVLPMRPSTPQRPSQRRTRRMRDHAKRSLGKTIR